MNSTLLLSLAGFAFISAITPGPNNLLLMSSTALFGWQRSLPHLGGVLLGFAILMTSAVFGLGSVVAKWPWLVTAITDSIVQRAMIIVGVFFIAGVVACPIWMMAGDALSRYMSSGKSATYVNLGMGTLILLTALHILLG
ncbi:MAG: hypothetical protein IIA09_12180 [Proteobacteria bacterium]|nr:hypothetical protein [Pseudomonadota bacterium]